MKFDTTVNSNSFLRCCGHKKKMISIEQALVKFSVMEYYNLFVYDPKSNNKNMTF